MTNSYCGKNCTFCISHEEGKCIGCKPEVHEPIHNSIYIPGSNDTNNELLLPGETVKENEEAAECNEGVRFSKFCQIAQCCRKNDREDCYDCQKAFACEAYSKKGIMNTVIETRMEIWGMVDHGLKNAVPYLYILLFCMLTEFVFPLSSIYPNISVVFFIISGMITSAKAYAFYKLRSFNIDFYTVMALTIAYIFATLFERLLNVIDYGLIGMLLSVACVLVQVASSILCYKISFDAYAELISPVDAVLESRWLKLWRLTIIFYIIAFVVGLFSMSSFGFSTFILSFAVAYEGLNILSFIFMISTINACKND